ncbi:hypothetical protein XENOCAPTIV_013584, partial [Xenoophorus captivus]
MDEVSFSHFLGNLQTKEWLVKLSAVVCWTHVGEWAGSFADVGRSGAWETASLNGSEEHARKILAVVVSQFRHYTVTGLLT